MNTFNVFRKNDTNIRVTGGREGNGASEVGAACKLKLSQRISVRVQDHLALSLERMAESEGRKTSDLVRQLVVEALLSRYETACGMGNCSSHSSSRQTIGYNINGENAQ